MVQPCQGTGSSQDGEAALTAAEAKQEQVPYVWQTAVSHAFRIARYHVSNRQSFFSGTRDGEKECGEMPESHKKPQKLSDLFKSERTDARGNRPGSYRCDRTER